MLITKEIEIDMAHRLPYHEGKCRSLHGHRYKIEVTVEGEVIDIEFAKDTGMILDYGDLKNILIEYIDGKFDHGAIFYDLDPFKPFFIQMLELGDQNPDKIHFVNFIPTAENLCKYWFDILEKPLLKQYGIILKQLKVWETPTSAAIYTK